VAERISDIGSSGGILPRGTPPGRPVALAYHCPSWISRLRSLRAPRPSRLPVAGDRDRLPTFREAETISDHAEAVFKVLPETTLLVVDDDSPDGTADVVENLRARHPRLHLIRRPPPRSFTGSYKDGIAWAIENGFSRVVSMDADGSHAADFLPLLLDSPRRRLVVGSRYLYASASSTAAPPRPPLGVREHLRPNRHGVPIDDLTSGFCCYRVEMLRKIGLENLQSRATRTRSR